MARQFQLVEMTASDPLERGKQYGEQARELIGVCVEHYRERFTASLGQSWEAIKAFSMQFVPAIEGYMPTALEEARGIAAGSGKTLEEIMVVNCRYEISKFPRLPECTTAAVLPSASRGGKTYLVKNWDYDDRIAPHIVLLKIATKEGYKAFGITEAGQMVRDGMNNSGVAFVNNNLQSMQDSPSIGLPATFIRKRLLECKSFDEACGAVTGAQRSVSCNTIVADASGKAVDFEAYPGGADSIQATDGILTHANHFVVNPGLDFFVDAPKNRDTRLYELLAQKRGEITAEYIMECLKDHEYHPLSICSHSHALEDGSTKHRSTVSSTIMNLTDGEAHVCVEHPCQNEYITYKL